MFSDLALSGASVSMFATLSFDFGGLTNPLRNVSVKADTSRYG